MGQKISGVDTIGLLGSDRPYKIYLSDGITLKFKHTDNKLSRCEREELFLASAYDINFPEAILKEFVDGKEN